MFATFCFFYLKLFVSFLIAARCLWNTEELFNHSKGSFIKLQIPVTEDKHAEVGQSSE